MDEPASAVQGLSHIARKRPENEPARVRKMTPAELRWRALLAATLARRH